MTAFIDDLRAVFGEAEINEQIRRGLHADCRADRTFYASEGGVVLGRQAVYPVGSVVITPVVWHPVVVGRGKA